jgi:hypothetical protein
LVHRENPDSEEHYDTDPTQISCVVISCAVLVIFSAVIDLSISSLWCSAALFANFRQRSQSNVFVGEPSCVILCGNANENHELHTYSQKMVLREI